MFFIFKNYIYFLILLFNLNLYSSNYSPLLLKDTLTKIVNLSKSFDDEHKTKAAELVSTYFSKGFNKDIKFSAEIANENKLFFYQLIKFNYDLEIDGKKILIHEYLNYNKDNFNKEFIEQTIKNILQTKLLLTSKSNSIYDLIFEKNDITAEEINSLIYEDKKGVDVLFDISNLADFYVAKILFFKLLQNNKADYILKSDYLKISLKIFSWLSLFYIKNTLIDSISANKINNVLITNKLFNEICESIKTTYSNFEDFLEFNNKNYFIFDLFLIAPDENNTNRTIKDVISGYYLSKLLQSIKEKFYSDTMSLRNENKANDKSIKNIITNLINKGETEIKKINDNIKMNNLKKILGNDYLYIIEQTFINTNMQLSVFFINKLQCDLIELKRYYLVSFKQAGTLTKEKILEQIKEDKFFDFLNKSVQKNSKKLIKEDKKNFLQIKKTYDKDFELFFSKLDKSVLSFTKKYDETYNNIFNRHFEYTNKVLFYLNKKIANINLINKENLDKHIVDSMRELNIFYNDTNIVDLIQTQNLKSVNINDFKFENYQGIDALLYGIDFVKYYFLNILFFEIIDEEKNVNLSLYSTSLGINLSIKTWQNIIFLNFDIIKFLSSNKYKALFYLEEEILNYIFNEIKEKYQTLDDFLKFDNNSIFFDTHLVNLEEISLRKKLIYYYLDEKYKQLFANKNKKISDEIKNNLENFLDDFLCKINYDIKINLITNKDNQKNLLLYLELLDENIVEDYFKDRTGFEKKSRLTKRKLKNEYLKQQKNDNKIILEEQKISEITKNEIKQEEQKEQKKSFNDKSNKNNKNAQISNARLLGRAISDILISKQARKEDRENKINKVKNIISNPISFVKQSFYPPALFNKIHKNNHEFLIEASKQSFNEYQSQVKEVSKNIFEELISVEGLIYLLSEDHCLTNNEKFYDMKNERENIINSALNLIDLMNDGDCILSVDKSVINLTNQIMQNYSAFMFEQDSFYNFININANFGSIKDFLLDPDLANKSMEDISAIFSDAKNEIKHKRTVSESIVPYKMRMDSYYEAIRYCYEELLKIKKNNML